MNMSPDLFSSLIGKKNTENAGLVGAKIAPVGNGKIYFWRYFTRQKNNRK